ncbi:MAG: type II secretion system GspH family protein [Gammaproteobacteria bacterium]|nr:type II secretion system GspH family protein [Gammaproteobacteria bacterium]
MGSNYKTGSQRGFTIIEMVITIVVGGIIASVIAQFITRPMEGYIALSRRAELVDIAETALSSITRDVRQALPNSVRISCAGQCIEFLLTIDGGRYRAKPPGDHLKFSGGDSSFDTLGPLLQRTNIINNIVSTPANCFTSTRYCISVFNTGLLNANAYQKDNIVSITALTTAGDGISNNITFDNSTLLPNNNFPFESPQQRFYIVSTPVSYICASGVITRYHNYSVLIDQPESAPAGASSGMLANKVSSCQFEYTAGTTTRSGLVIAGITISDSGESITLLEQAHIFNQP